MNEAVARRPVASTRSSTDLAVSKICFGTSALGDMPDTYGHGVVEERAKKTVRTVFGETSLAPPVSMGSAAVKSEAGPLSESGAACPKAS
jgi:hypothetical protein